MIYLFRQKKAFTIPELLMAASIMVLVAGAAMALYVMLQSVWVEETARMDLEREARKAMDQMVRLAIDREGAVVYPAIVRGTSVPYDPAGDDNIEFTVDMNNPPTPDDTADDTTRKFYLSGNRIMCNPDTSSTNEFPIAEHISSLAFSYTSGVVTINLSANDQASDKTVYLSTAVKLRNVSQ